ncbi:hypothetical protein ACH5RR_039196 [Cinchona calisaya]|uniref:Uncharacterized protein n=1 Tax=Cinchona calisaya TaxID=153742 RepID=A0ABD2Y349_9GENT
MGGMEEGKSVRPGGIGREGCFGMWWGDKGGRAVMVVVVATARPRVMVAATGPQMVVAEGVGEKKRWQLGCVREGLRS